MMLAREERLETTCCRCHRHASGRQRSRSTRVVEHHRRRELIVTPRHHEGGKTRLQDAVDEMNRYSAVKLVIEDPQAAEIPVSGIFRAGDSTRFAQAVAETYHLRIDYQERRIVIQ